MGSKREIKDMIDRYVSALEKDDFSDFGDFVCEDAKLLSTNYGNGEGIDAVISKLKWQGLPYSCARYKVFNFVCFVQDGLAKVSCVISALIGDDDGYFHYFQFAGYCLFDLIRKDGKWMIQAIRFNLDMEDGNTLMVKGWWKMIDYGVYCGTDEYPITSEYDNPWIAFEDPEPFENEEDAVKDAMFRYAWGIDHSDFTVFASCCKNQIKMVNEKNDGTISGLDNVGDFMSKEEMIRLMKYKRYKEATMEHIYKICSVEIDGDHALLKAYRYEPHRMQTTKLNRLNKDMDFYSGSFFYEFEKVDGKYPNGGWKMATNGIRTLKTFNDGCSGKRRFFSEDE